MEMSSNNIEQIQSKINISKNIAYLKVFNSKELLLYKDIIQQMIDNNEIRALVVIVGERNISWKMDKDKKVELDKWLGSLLILSVVVIDGECDCDVAEFIMMFDIRIGGKKLSIKLPNNDENIAFNYYQRCQLLMGKSINTEEYVKNSGKKLEFGNEYFKRLIIKTVESEYLMSEVQDYIEKIIGSKDSFHIKSIVKCFNNYRLLGLNEERQLLLEEEARQFYILTIRSYLG